MENTKEHPMTATTMTLVEFLRARLDEDEAVARAAEDCGPWSVKDYGEHGFGCFPGEPCVVSDDGPNDAYGAVCGAEYEGYHSTVLPGNAAHIARHDPARVLADVAARRLLIERIGNPSWAGFEYLALPYADHPDYREEWKP